MSKDLGPEPKKKKQLRGLGGWRGQRILRRALAKKWTKNNEKLQKDK